MKRPEKREGNVEEFVLRHMGLFKAPQEEMDLAEKRIQERLRSAPATAEFVNESTSVARRWKLPVLVFGTAAAVVVLMVFLQMTLQIDAHAIVESADGSLSRISGGKTQVVHTGERIEAGEILRTNDSNGSIALADGSHVELRAASEFSVERAGDGVRIHLFKGRLIVRAARQVAGHLYVQTKDVTVSVVGTLFLVNAEDEGSRVAVIEGQVRVQQGTTTKNLLPGEQMTTNPNMVPLVVNEEVSWSGNAEIQMAVLQQTTAAAQKPAEARVAFDVISIRPSAPLQIIGRGGPPDGVPGASVVPPEIEQNMARRSACGGVPSALEVNPGRLAITSATVYRLIVLAYGLKDCPLAIQVGLVSGGPDWVKSDRFDIQATIPEGSAVYTREQLNNGEASKLQLMIQDLLADRFKLSLHRGLKDIQGFNLVVVKTGKIKLSADQTPPGPYDVRQGFRSTDLPRGVMLNCVGNAVSISSVADCLQKMAGGPIADKTDLKGLYDIPQAASPDALAPISESLRLSQTLEQIGLKLEPKRVPREAFTIERVEKPSEN